MDLNGAAAIISGGASGLGEATARELAGVRRHRRHRRPQRASAARHSPTSSAASSSRPTSPTRASVQAAVDVAVATGKPLRVVVSSAGIGWASRTVGRDGSPHDLASYRKVIDVNLIGTFNLMRIGAAAMAKTEPADADGARGVVDQHRLGRGHRGPDRPVAYSASKGGIIGMTLPAARDLAAVGVRVLTIGPGHHRHPHLRLRARAGRVQGQARPRPVVFPKRMGRASEFAHLVRALIENDYMNAEVIRFDGGIRFQPK